MGDSSLMRMLKREAQEQDTTIKAVLKKALEAYFHDRLETRALQSISESIFKDWDNPLDAEYDKI